MGDVSPARRKLVKLLQYINHGRLCGLAVKGGEPVFDPPPQVIRTVKFPGVNSPRPEVELHEFALKTHFQQLFDYLDSLGNGLIEILEVRDGLPVAGAIQENPHLN